MRKNVFVKTLATILVAAVLALTVNTEAKAAQAIASGIDVSKYNGAIDWNKVAKSGVKFAFIRVGNPQTGLDPTFAANMIGAQAAGVKTGVYYYSHATTVEAAKAEAMQTISWLSQFPVNYPVVYDVEASGQKKLSAAAVQQIVNTYCTLIDAAGYYPVVYSYKNFYQTKLNGIVWDKWVAQYNGACDIPGAAFWQYGSKGKVAGIKGNVDMNYQFKDYSKLIIADGFVAHGNAIRYYAGWKMQTGWVNVNGLRYHMDNLGNMQVGWFTDTDGKTYYLMPADGHAAIGVQAVDGVNYLFDIMGAKCVGITQLGDSSFYCDPVTGELKTGWITGKDGNTYYADQTGVMAKGVYLLGDMIYYFNEKGALVRNGSFKVDGVPFVTTADGIVVPAGN